MEFLTEVDILERVDEYSLFCFYLNFEPIIGGVYRSPIRIGDDIPSFGMYERRVSLHKFPTEYMWKDAAIPYPNFGDIFDLVQVLCSLETRSEALLKIASDFGLGGIVMKDVEVKRLVLCEPEFKAPTNISIKSQPFSHKDQSYWQRYNVGLDTLSEYLITSVGVFWLNEGGRPLFPSQCYGYRIHNKYQLYQPYAARSRKFLNNWTELCIPGWAQLKGYSNLIITKAYKDVACIASLASELQTDVISPRGENILLPEKAIKSISVRYQNVITLMDNDGKCSPHKYPFRSRFIPLESGEKDTTDYMVRYGKNKTTDLLKQLLYE